VVSRWNTRLLCCAVTEKDARDCTHESQGTGTSSQNAE